MRIILNKKWGDEMNALRPLMMISIAFTATMLAACGSSNSETTTAVENWPTAPLIDPNTATSEQLTVIPGITESLAQAVIDARPIATPTALNAILADGLEPEVLRNVYKVMSIKVGLNTGDLEDYKLIPSSLSPRKLSHEFEEYRPYKSMDDFTREMAKYVDADEVAYLTRYVTIE
ncbi:MAG: helix-hairpin-helix domain-containing protein [Pseudomonadota bacterium]